MRRDVRVTVKNNTEKSLTLQGNPQLKHGKWRDNGEPPYTIQPNREGEFQAGKQTGSSYGVEGRVVYEIDENVFFEIDFSDPRNGDNSASVHATGKDKYLYEEEISYNKEGQPLYVKVNINPL